MERKGKARVSEETFDDFLASQGFLSSNRRRHFD